MSSENQALHAVASSITKFSTDFYKALAENEKSNFICSPISVSMVLSMVTYGARGNTEKELRSVLGLSEDDQLNKDGFQSLIDNLNAVETVVLNLANKIYFNTKFNVKPEFKKLTETSFRSVSEIIDFGNTSEASKTINSWCEEKTNNCIKNVVQPGDLIDSQMVLVNAVYFKGEWKWQFDPKRTKPEPFHIDKNTTKDVPMMIKTTRYNTNELADLDAKFIELRYKSNEPNHHPITMFIILPDEINNINTLESKVHTINFKDLHDNSIYKDCTLRLPKFKVESRPERNFRTISRL
ncbi:serine protease inhibitor 42Dd-like [Microplitis mediator]|uniref:serine protease inhibitor 42Dd-like n=1 Tax=Microplitis mediator TaxID=375433 RepID=UPI002556D8E4|nr:serine protease inhibitor 42Dd-like [Microplitis mediator]